MNFKWRQTKDRNIFLSSPLPKLFWHVVGRLHQVIGLLHAIPSLLAFFHMNLCCLDLRVDFALKIPYFYISNNNIFTRYIVGSPTKNGKVQFAILNSLPQKFIYGCYFYGMIFSLLHESLSISILEKLSRGFVLHVPLL